MNNNMYQTPFIPNYNVDNDYVENYLKQYVGKNIETHVSFCDSIEWRDSVFTGKLVSVGKDYIAINNNKNTYIIWNIYLDYVVLKE